jgi:hypothetical protein
MVAASLRSIVKTVALGIPSPDAKAARKSPTTSALGSRTSKPLRRHQRANCAQSEAYALRVFVLERAAA